MILNKVKAMLFCAGAALVSSASAANYDMSVANISKEYTFVPKITTEVANYRPWAIRVNCRVITRINDDEDARLSFQATKESIIINNEVLAIGKSTVVNAKAGDTISVEADPHAYANVVNLGEHEVNLKCYSSKK
jgi:hypothetical protein